MGNLIQKVRHEKFGDIRVVVLDGKVYFVAIDVAKVLGFKDTDKAIRVHVQVQDKKKLTPSELAGVTQNVGGVKISSNAILISESGLWSLVLYSRLPFAKELQHWITSEVLPSIMRNGYYVNPAVSSPAFEDFTRREKVDILLKLLNATNVPALKNQIIRHIDFLLSAEYETLLNQIEI